MPKQCINCGAFGNYVCQRCNAQFSFYEVQYCHVCKEPVIHSYTHGTCLDSTHLEGVLVCAQYNKLAQRIVGEIKYSLYYSLIEYIGPIMVQKIYQHPRIFNVHQCLLVPVPLHAHKQKVRGFNQAEILSQYISSKTGIKTKHMIRRVRNTRTQVGLSRLERMRNLENAFEMNTRPDLGAKNTAILVDDVMTTGTTLEECAIVLKRSGFTEVYAIVFARG